MKKHRADWMAAGSFGVMVHYIVNPGGESRAEKTADFNRVVDAFDLDGFIGQFMSTGADWLIFTFGQCTNCYCSPNQWLDEQLPGYTSNRDLMREMGERLHASGKRLIMYLPAETETLCPELQEVFGANVDPVEHMRRYQAFVADYSKKMSGLFDGWWFDGCYPHIREKYAWNWENWLAAARAGNPDAITAFNDAAFCAGLIKPVTPLEEYHAGEVHMLENGKIRTDFINPDGDIVRTDDGRIRIRGQEPVLYMPDSRFIDGVQWHALVPVDSTFNPGIPDMHYDDKELFSFVKACRKVGGAVTLNAPLDIETGLIDERTAAQCARLGKALRG